MKSNMLFRALASHPVLPMFIDATEKARAEARAEVEEKAKEKVKTKAETKNDGAIRDEDTWLNHMENGTCANTFFVTCSR